MLSPMLNSAETIVAVSSPPGQAARGIVRMSGPNAIEIAARLFRPQRAAEFSQVESRRRTPGTIAVGGTDLPAVAYVFRRPHSYTREDFVELHLLGAPAVLTLLVDACFAEGARRAGPGEFTATAFVNGAFDLAEAQGVAALIAAQSDGELRAARQLLRGDLSRIAADAREELADLLSLVEGALDFADEPIEFITSAELRRRLSAVRDRLDRTLSSASAAERLGALPRVVLAGPPNAGKSSLLNRLTGVDRALCSPIRGTTRDVLAAPLRLAHGEALLLDVAGLDAAGHALDRKAQAAASEAIESADVVLWVVSARFDEARPRPSRPAGLIVLNKIDAVSESTTATLRAEMSDWGAPIALVSAQTGAGCAALLDRIDLRLRARLDDSRDPQLCLAAEQREAIIGARDAIDRAASLAIGDDAIRQSAELISLELHEAADRLGQISGALVPDELLGRIFARFCIGK